MSGELVVFPRTLVGISSFTSPKSDSLIWSARSFLLESLPSSLQWSHTTQPRKARLSQTGQIHTSGPGIGSIPVICRSVMSTDAGVGYWTVCKTMNFGIMMIMCVFVIVCENCSRIYFIHTFRNLYGFSTLLVSLLVKSHPTVYR